MGNYTETTERILTETTELIWVIGYFHPKGTRAKPAAEART